MRFLCMAAEGLCLTYCIYVVTTEETKHLSPPYSDKLKKQWGKYM